MSYAVTLRLDVLAAAVIRGMWRALADGGFDDDCQALGYAPHLTLATYPDDAPIHRLRQALQVEAAEWAALPVAFSGFGIFPQPFPIVWVAPVSTPALLDRHAAVQALLPDMLPQAHCRTGAWVPHVTSAGGSGALHDPAGAVAALLPSWRPLAGRLDRLDLARFRPVEVLWSQRLASSP